MTHYSAVIYSMWSREIRALPCPYLPFSSWGKKLYGFSCVTSETLGLHFLWQWFNSVPLRDEITPVHIEISAGEDSAVVDYAVREVLWWWLYTRSMRVIRLHEIPFLFIWNAKNERKPLIVPFFFFFLHVKLRLWVTWSVKVKWLLALKDSMTNWCYHRTIIEESTSWSSSQDTSYCRQTWHLSFVSISNSVSLLVKAKGRNRKNCSVAECSIVH